METKSKMKCCKCNKEFEGDTCPFCTVGSNEKTNIKEDLVEMCVGGYKEYRINRFKFIFIGVFIASLAAFSQKLIIPGIMLMISSFLLCPWILNKFLEENKKTVKIISFVLIVFGVFAINYNHESKVSDEINFEETTTKATVVDKSDIKSIIENTTNNIVETTEPVADNFSKNSNKVTADEFIGGWGDIYSKRCSMNIEYDDMGKYIIEIHWSNSVFDAYDWIFTGYFDEENSCISYVGVQKHVVYNEYEEYIYTDGEGILYISDGCLYWVDYKENIGEKCIFVNDAIEKEDGYITGINYPWYVDNSYFMSADDNENLMEVYCQNDVMLVVKIYVGEISMDWLFKVDSSKMGKNGELIYTDGSNSLTYYPTDNHIKFENIEGLLAGVYIGMPN